MLASGIALRDSMYFGFGAPFCVWVTSVTGVLDFFSMKLSILYKYTIP
jgi:hypothetical protein